MLALAFLPVSPPLSVFSVLSGAKEMPVAVIVSAVTDTVKVMRIATGDAR